MSGPDQQVDKSRRLLAQHADQRLLVLVNVWDVATARVVAGVAGTTALATASHSIAAAHGYDDGENIPLDLMLDAVGRIAAAVDLPVTADLEGGYGDAGETVRRAVGLGVVGANIEDAMRPLAESVATVQAALRAAEDEGVPLVLNARTDAVLFADGRERSAVLADAVQRGRAYLDAGAACVFVPGALDRSEVEELVGGIGERRVSLLAGPGSLPLAELERLGVARVSVGPWSQRLALTALADAAAAMASGGSLPDAIRPLG